MEKMQLPIIKKNKGKTIFICNQNTYRGKKFYQGIFAAILVFAVRT